MGGRRVIIHAGFHKSGSTFLQSTLFANRRVLQEHGIDYFPFMANHSWPIYLRFADHPLGHPLSIRHKLGSTGHLSLLQDLVEKSLRRFLAKGSTNTKIISGESLCKMSEAALKRLRDYLLEFCNDVTVVIYCRNYFEYLDSIVQENIKNGASLEDARSALFSSKDLHPSICMPGYFPNYRMKIEKFDNVFGESNTIARAFHPEAFHDGNLLGDFCAAIGFEGLASTLNGAETGRNASVSALAVAVIDKLNQRTPLLQNQKINPERPFQNHRHILDLPGVRFQLDDPDLLAAYRKGIEQDADWLGHRIGETALDLLLKEPDAIGQPPAPSDREMVDILLDCVSRLNRSLEAEQAAARIERNLHSTDPWSESKTFALSFSIKAIDDPAVLIAFTYRLLRRGAVSLAAIAADRAVELDAKLSSAIAAKAAVAIRQRRWSDGQRLAENLLGLSDVNPVAWRQLGISLGGLNQIAQAKEALARAIKLAPKDPQNHFQLGNLLFRVERLADAEKAIRAALSLSPGDDRIKATLDNILAARGCAAADQPSE